MTQRLSETTAAALMLLFQEASGHVPISALRASIRAQYGVRVEQELRALAAGLEVKGQQHIVTRHDRNTFQVESKGSKRTSAEPEHYLVDLDEWTCACKGYSVRKHCSHIDSAIAYSGLL